MVRRGSTVRVRQRASAFSLLRHRFRRLQQERVPHPRAAWDPWAAALEARMLCGLFDQVCESTKGDGVAFPGEADCIEVELADRLVRGCYLVGKAVAVNRGSLGKGPVTGA